METAEPKDLSTMHHPPMDPLSEPYLMDEDLAGSSDDAFYDRLSKTNFKSCKPHIEQSSVDSGFESSVSFTKLISTAMIRS